MAILLAAQTTTKITSGLRVLTKRPHCTELDFSRATM